MWGIKYCAIILCFFVQSQCSDGIQELFLHNECSICLQSVNEETSACRFSFDDSYFSCKHFSFFHSSCIEKWKVAQQKMKQNRFCPLCRSHFKWLVIKPISLPSDGCTVAQSLFSGFIPCALTYLSSGTLVIAGKKKRMSPSCFVSKEQWIPIVFGYKNNMLDRSFGALRYGNDTKYLPTSAPRNDILKKIMACVSWGGEFFVGCDVTHSTILRRRFGVVYGYDSNGISLQNFGNHGILECDQVKSVDALMVAEKERRLFVAGVSRNLYNSLFVVASFDEQGVPLRSFGKAGIAVVPTLKGCLLHALKPMGDSTFVIVGKDVDSITNKPALVVARFFLNGQIDKKWGREGKAVTIVEPEGTDGSSILCDVESLDCVASSPDQLHVTATSFNTKNINDIRLIHLQYNAKGECAFIKPIFFTGIGQSVNDICCIRDFNKSLLMTSDKKIICVANQQCKEKNNAIVVAAYRFSKNNELIIDAQEAFCREEGGFCRQGKSIINNDEELGELKVCDACLDADNNITITGMRKHGETGYVRPFVASLDSKSSLVLF